MSKTSVLLGCIFVTAAFFACKKDAPYDETKQMEIDDALIVKFLKDSSLVDSFIKDSSGLYHHIIRAGKGNVSYTDKDFIAAKYTLKVLRDSVVRDKRLDSTFAFQLPGYIKGWQTGARLIQPGGKIRLLVPSPLGYQQRVVANPIIPPNSILDITLEIDSVKKQSND